MTDNKWLKGFYFVASTIPALSRVSENAHYPSQAILGWTLAYVSTTSIAETENPSANYSITPLWIGDSMGLGISLKR